VGIVLQPGEHIRYDAVTSSAPDLVGGRPTYSNPTHSTAYMFLRSVISDYHKSGGVLPLCKRPSGAHNWIPGQIQPEESVPVQFAHEQEEGPEEEPEYLDWEDRIAEGGTDSDWDSE
jgi:hypothetical protein